MDVLDLYETGEWSAANSPCSELFEDSDLASGSDLDESCGYLDDISIDFASYLDPTILSTSPDDFCKYLDPKETRGAKKLLLPQSDSCGFLPQKVKVEPLFDPPTPAVTSKFNSVVEKDQQKSKLPSAASQLKAPSSRSTRRNSSKKQISKCSDEYRQKRERNNIAVRKSRFKSKQKFVETQRKVDELVEENDNLHSKVNLLTKELNVLRSLFTNSGAFKDPSVAAALLAHGISNHAGSVAPPNKFTGSCR